ncbi:MAG TPA: pectate lyase [Vicinamibacterales bacterium]|nr:pectate lyase [Vicinamibacterales bacterium]
MLLALMVPALSPSPAQSAAAAPRPRVIVSTDIGGTDPDDHQSMVHFLLYADMFDVEALVSSPYGPGRREHILQVIDLYEKDYANLKSHSPRYPAPDTLRAITWEGAIESAGPAGFDRPTDGSRHIIESARRADPRPLYVLVWGGIDDLAQALHDAPDILPKLRVYFIGGPNKTWSVNAYNYIEQHHPGLWIIEANATYRGWFTGGNQSGEWGNTPFVAAHVAGRGALGGFFATLLGGTIKMGDSPSVGYLLHGTPEDPSHPGWGGQFVRVWDGRTTTFDRLTTASDIAEAFGVVEFALPVPAGMTARDSAQMIFDGRIPVAGANDGRVLRFRFSPRDAKVWSYAIKSDVPGLDGQSGQFTAAPPTAERTRRPSARHPNWWIDDPDPAAAEGVHPGAKHVSRWREEFLRDFAARLSRTGAPAQAPGAIRWGAGVLRQKPEWYATREATGMADSVMQYQAADGGWPKNTDLGVRPPSAESRAAAGADVTWSTIDNNGTTMPMQFLALVTHATGEARYRASFLRGFDYLLAAQYPNGGWPQFFPLRPGYYTHVTFNDNAMVNVLTVLRDAATGSAPYSFVDEARRTKARAAVSRGIDIILKTQVKQDGKLTAWCAQHDEKTLAPAWARAYEPPSLSGSESVGIVRFLMEIERPAPAIVAAIEGAAGWLRSVAIPGLRLETFTGADGRSDRRVVPDPAAGLLWARFYELGTNRPIFLGRDSVVRPALSEIEYERRNGYAYYGQWPASLLDTDFPRWREKHSR